MLRNEEKEEWFHVLSNFNMGRRNNYGTDFHDLALLETVMEESLKKKLQGGSQEEPDLWSLLHERGENDIVKHICEKCCGFIFSFLRNDIISQQEINFMLFDRLRFFHKQAKESPVSFTNFINKVFFIFWKDN